MGVAVVVGVVVVNCVWVVWSMLAVLLALLGRQSGARWGTLSRGGLSQRSVVVRLGVVWTVVPFWHVSTDVGLVFVCGFCGVYVSCVVGLYIA